MKNVDVDLHREEEGGAVKVREIYNHMYYTKEYYEGGRGGMKIYLETSSNTVS